MIEPRTIADLLGDTSDALHADGTARRELPVLAATAYRIAEARMAEVLQSELSIDLGDVLLEALRTGQELVAAARRTRDRPGPPEDVVLYDCPITQPYEVTVDVLVDGQVRASVTFDVEVSLTLRAAEAVVDAGRLTGLRLGAVVAGASLSLHGVVLAAPETRVINGLHVPLGQGVPLTAGSVPRQRTASPAALPWWQRT